MAATKKNTNTKKDAPKKVPSTEVASKKVSAIKETTKKAPAKKETPKTVNKKKVAPKRAAEEDLKKPEEDELLADSSDEEETAVETLAKEIDSSDEEEEEEKEKEKEKEKPKEEKKVEPETKKTKKPKKEETLADQIGQKLKDKLDTINNQEETDESERGVVYLGRIPKAFDEKAIGSYFKQFGTVTRFRLSRNLKTGNTRHYAFIEFLFKEVAEIVAEAMNNYLLQGRLLKCKVVPKEKIHTKLFWGAGKKVQPFEYIKKEQEKRQKSKTEEQQYRYSVRLLKKEEDKKKKLKLAGINYDFDGLSKKVTIKKPASVKKVPEPKNETPKDPKTEKVTAKSKKIKVAPESSGVEEAVTKSKKAKVAPKSTTHKKKVLPKSKV